MDQIFKKNCLKWLLLPLFITIICILGYTIPVYADMSIWLNQDEADNTGSVITYLQTFTPDQDRWLSTLYLPGNDEIEEVYIHLCKGTGIASGTPIGAKYCNYSNHELIATTTCQSDTSNYYCAFSASYPVYSGEDYYITYYSEDSSLRSSTEEWGGSETQAGQVYFQNSVWPNKFTGYANPSYWNRTPDLYLQIWYDDTVYQEPSTTTNEYYDDDLSTDEPDINSLYNKTCYVGEDCILHFSFNVLAIGGTVYLNDYASTSIPSTALASTTVTVSPFWQNYVELPAEHDNVYRQYNLTLVKDLNWYVITGINVYWVTREEWDAFMDSRAMDILNEYCNYDTLCDDIATGTDWFDFKYGIQCGGRYLSCWLFYPNASTTQEFYNTITETKQQFPMNLFFRMRDMFQEIQDYENTNVLTFNFTDIIGVPGFEDELVIASSTSMSYVFGDMWDRIYWIMERLIYLFGFIYIITRLIYFTRGGQVREADIEVKRSK